MLSWHGWAGVGGIIDFVSGLTDAQTIAFGGD